MMSPYIILQTFDLDSPYLDYVIRITSPTWIDVNIVNPIYVRMQGNAHPMNLSPARLLFEGGSYFFALALRAATIRGRLLFDVRLLFRINTSLLMYKMLYILL